VPHFEKMLYDNAELIRFCNWAYAASGNDLFRVRIEDTVDWLLREMRVDCDQDALLVRAELDGGAVCHEGYRSCFFREISRDGEAKVIAERILSPEELYGKAKK